MCACHGPDLLGLVTEPGAFKLRLRGVG